MKISKVIIAPDSFKGVLPAEQVADVIAEEVCAAFPGCTVIKIPIADGGEGSIDVILAAVGGEKIEAQVLSPDDRLITAVFGVSPDATAIIEMAQSSGLSRQEGLHPMTSGTYGFGQLILAALDHGARDFVLCIGGSATTDGGCGMASALGVLFLDSHGGSFVPCGGTLGEIARIDLSRIDKRIRECRFSVMCDVDNPLFGKDGAAHVYAPQKGADHGQVLILDRGLRHLGTLLRECFGMDLAGIPGAGAAGGLGAGCMAFLNAKLVSGSEAMLSLCGFESHLVGADLIITGEGKLDMQSFNGKVLSGILSHAAGIPVCSICGVCECDVDSLTVRHVDVFEASEGVSVEESMGYPVKYLRAAARKAMVLYAEK